MKILFFIDRLLQGGIQTLVLNLTLELKKRDNVKIDFLLFNDGCHYELEDVFSSMGCCIYKVSWPKLKSLNKTCLQLDRFFAKHHEYDIIHAHSSSKAVLPLYYAKKYGIKVRIAHSHNTKFQTHNPLLIIVGNILKYPLSYLSTHYFACSVLAGQWLFGKDCINKKKVKVLNNAIDLTRYVYDNNIRKNVRKELSIPDGVTVIGHVGRFSVQKNHKFLITIFSSYLKANPTALLLLVGQGELQTDIEDMVKSAKLEKNVLFMGMRKDVNLLYQAMDLFLMPSLHEGLPFVGIEAQASGLPCLFSDTVTKELKILDSTYFQKLSDSPNLWANSIRHILRNSKREDVTSQMTLAGYDIVNESQKLYNYYKSLI